MLFNVGIFANAFQGTVDGAVDLIREAVPVAVQPFIGDDQGRAIGAQCAVIEVDAGDVCVRGVVVSVQDDRDLKGSATRSACSSASS